MKATDREKALIFALAAGGLEGWMQVYLLSRDKPPKNNDPSSLRPVVSRWKQREEIRQAYQNATDILKAREDRTRAEALEEARREMMKEETPGESEHPKRKKGGPVDYYNPAAQRDQINKIIQEAEGDPKTQLDAIKAIQQTQRDDRQAAKDAQIQRFYVPLNCKTCPLKLKKAKKTD